MDKYKVASVGNHHQPCERNLKEGLAVASISSMYVGVGIDYWFQNQQFYYNLYAYYILSQFSWLGKDDEER